MCVGGGGGVGVKQITSHPQHTYSKPCRNWLRHEEAVISVRLSAGIGPVNLKLSAPSIFFVSRFGLTVRR